VSCAKNPTNISLMYLSELIVSTYNVGPVICLPFIAYDTPTFTSWRGTPYQRRIKGKHMKWYLIRFFWDVAPSSHIEVTDDGGSMHLWNVGQLQRDYTVLHPRRLQTSYLPPWELEMSQEFWKFLRKNFFRWIPTYLKVQRVCACTGTALSAPLINMGKFILLFLWCDTWFVFGRIF
jgi:hypothetical protein